MADTEHHIEIDFLDHVAIRVSDIEVSAVWYETVLGLKRYKLPEWGDVPIFLLSGKSGIALFPANPKDPQLHPTSKNINPHHFAFNVTKINFEKASKRYTELGLDFDIQNHFYFDSIYTKDPDGHIVELTTIKVSEQEFYRTE